MKAVILASGLGTRLSEETGAMHLDATHTGTVLGWNPRWYADSSDSARIRTLTLAQIDDYTTTT